jgi:hypothetical protein
LAWLMNVIAEPFSVPVTVLTAVLSGRSIVSWVEVVRSQPFEFGTLAVIV